MAEREEWLKGETGTLRATFYDWNNEKVDPTAVTVSIWNNEGIKKIDEATATRQAEGEYYYRYTVSETETIDVAEQWSYLFTGTTGADVTREKGYFTVTDFPLVTYYATIQDIEMLLQHDIDDTTHPSMQEVTRLIKIKENLIDKLTKSAWHEKTITQEYHYQRENPTGGLWIFFPFEYLPVRKVSEISVRTWGSEFTDHTDDTYFWSLDENMALRLYRYYTGWAKNLCIS